MREGIVFVQNCAEDHEDSETEEHAEDEFICFGELRGNEQGKGNAQHHDIGCNVEDGVSDQVVNSSGALNILNRDFPVPIEGTTPDTQVKNFHNNERNDNVCANNPDSELLLEAKGQLVVE